MPPPIYRCGHPAGHPKLLQLETPLPAVRTVQTYCTFMRSNVQLITPLYCAMYQLTRTLGMKNLSLFSGLLCRVGVFTQYDTTEHDSYITETHACIRTSVITNCVKQAYWCIQKTGTDHKISVNVSARYRVRTATRPTLVRLADHLEYNFRNIDKKSLNVM